MKSWNWNNAIVYAILVMVSWLSWHSSTGKVEGADRQGTAPLPVLSSPSSIPLVTSTPAASPRVLKFNLSLSSPQDLKVKRGDSITAGEVLADRVEERSRLVVRRRTLELSLQDIQEKTIVKPAYPVSVPAVNELPLVSYAEEHSAISFAKLAVQQAQREFDFQKEKLKSAPLEESSAVRRAEVAVNEKQRIIELQHRKIDAVEALKDLPSDVLIHEQAVLKTREAELQQAQADLEQAQAKERSAANAQEDRLQQLASAVEKTQAELQLAISKFQTAKDKRAYAEYEASITAARRIEEHNSAEQNYTRQLQEAAQQERDRSFQVAQIQAKIAEIDDQLNTLSTIKSPYAGTIERVKFIGQNDKNLSVEVVLGIRDGDGNTSVSTGTNLKDFPIPPIPH